MTNDVPLVGAALVELKELALRVRLSVQRDAALLQEAAVCTLGSAAVLEPLVPHVVSPIPHTLDHTSGARPTLRTCAELSGLCSGPTKVSSSGFGFRASSLSASASCATAQSDATWT